MTERRAFERSSYETVRRARSIRPTSARNITAGINRPLTDLSIVACPAVGFAVRQRRAPRAPRDSGKSIRARNTISAVPLTTIVSDKTPCFVKTCERTRSKRRAKSYVRIRLFLKLHESGRWWPMELSRSTRDISKDRDRGGGAGK